MNVDISGPHLSCHSRNVSTITTKIVRKKKCGPIPLW